MACAHFRALSRSPYHALSEFVIALVAGIPLTNTASALSGVTWLLLSHVVLHALGCSYAAAVATSGTSG